MRRKDRAVESIETIKDIVESCHVVRLGLFDGKYPYIVPVNFGYEWVDEELHVYIHGALEGKKLDCIQKNPHVCVEMDGNHQLIPGGRHPQNCSYAYRSFIGYGIAERLVDMQEKKHGLELLMKHEIGDTPYDDMPAKVMEKTSVIKIVITDYSAKEHLVN